MMSAGSLALFLNPEDKKKPQDAYHIVEKINRQSNMRLRKKHFQKYRNDVEG